MEVFLDTFKIDEMSLTGDNLEDILAELMKSHVPQNRIITEVLVDGRTYSEEYYRAATDLSRDKIGRLEIISIPGAELARLILDTGPGHLAVMVEAAELVAELFRVADEAEANEAFYSFLQTMQDFFSLLGQALDILEVPLSLLQAEGFSAQMKLKDLNSLLQNMMERQEDQDWVLLADLIEYELAPQLKDWQTLLSQARRASH